MGLPYYTTASYIVNKTWTFKQQPQQTNPNHKPIINVSKNIWTPSNSMSQSTLLCHNCFYHIKDYNFHTKYQQTKEYQWSTVVGGESKVCWVMPVNVEQPWVGGACPGRDAAEDKVLPQQHGRFILTFNNKVCRNLYYSRPTKPGHRIFYI